MNWTLEEIYKLLPVVYRLRDAERSEPLKALLAVIAEQAGVMEEDITRLYENWFIETCDEWVVPYIGDLLGVRGLNRVGVETVFSQRARVANTLSYRRRKGAPAMLEQLGRDTTGWNARVVEFFELLIAAQHYNHIRLHCGQTPDLRRTNELELLDTAFDTFAHSVDVRRIAINRGWHNIPNVGLFVWPLQSYFLQRASARVAAVSPDGRYFFSQLGGNLPLFNRPQTEEVITHLAEEVNVPGLLRRRPLYDELEARRQELADKMSPLYAALTDLRQALIEEKPSLTAELNALQSALGGGSSALFDELKKLINDLTLNTVQPETAMEILRKAALAVSGVAATWFRPQPVLQVFVQRKANGPFYELLPEEILICDLSDPPTPVPEVWLRPPTTKGYLPAGGGAKIDFRIAVAVDPALGRLAFPTGLLPNGVDVSYAYGFSGDVGGGPYNRRESVAEILEPKNSPRLKVGWQAGVSKTAKPIGAEKIFPTLTDAIAEWNTRPPGTVGVIAVMDNHTYKEDLTAANRIQIPEGSLLMIAAADWPVLTQPDGTKTRRNGRITPTERRPHLLGNVEVIGLAPDNSPNPGALVIDGLLVEGKLTVVTENAGPGNPDIGNLGRLRLAHTTLAPGNGGLTVTAQNGELQIEIARSVSGQIKITPPVGGLKITESIVDFAGAAAIDAVQTDVEIEKITALGGVNVRSLEADNSIFTGLIVAERRQEGCVRFSYVSDASKTPRRFRCQPDLALTDVTDADERAAIKARMNPSFTSDDYGHFGYCQLSRACAEEIRTGAEDGSEMGVFSFLKNPQREANLRASLDEFLPFGLEAGVIPVSLGG